MSILTAPYMQTGNAHLLPIDRNDPTLALYLPLWYPHGDMTGSTIYSYDKNRHSCTVTGATWGVIGRTFNGTSGVIDCGNSSAFDVTTGVTVELWLYSDTDGASQGLVCKRGAGANWPFDIYKWSDNQVLIGARGSAGENLDFDTSVAINTTGWHHLVYTYNKQNQIVYLDVATTESQANTTTMATNTDPIEIGANSSLTRWYKNLIGEVRIYNRALSVGEITRNYQATKWRYQ